jgi:UDP-N-acetylmuramoyl-tripeptide--D-alanyl-D-alanine ligase
LKLQVSELARFCAGKLLGSPDVQVTGVSTDTRTIRPGALFVAIQGPLHDGHDFLEDAVNGGAAALLVSKGSGSGPDVPRVEVENTVQALGEIAREVRLRFEGPVVAITGSNGKTTTKEMCASILDAGGVRVRRSPGNLNNHIGLPVSILGLEDGDQALVVELGANHPGEIDGLARIADPTVGAITQVAPAHLEGFGSIEGVAQAKGELIERIRDGGTAVLNADDPRVASCAERFGGRVLRFGLESPADFRADSVRIDETGTAFHVETPMGDVDVLIPSPGRHLVSLALCASACAFAIPGELTLESIATGLGRLTTPPGRLRVVRSPVGAAILDDSYNANPASTTAALETLSELARGGRTIAALGDMLELGEAEVGLHAALGTEIARLGIDVLVAAGPLSRHTTESARVAGVPTVHVVTDSEEAAELLRGLVGPGDTVLVKGSRGMRMERAFEALTGGAD